MRRIRIAAKRGANPEQLISRDCGADTTAANQYSDLRGACLHRFANLFRVVRIIVGNGTVVSTEVDQLMDLAQFLNNALIEREPSMIRSNRYFHNTFDRITRFSRFSRSNHVNPANPEILSNVSVNPGRDSAHSRR